MSFPSMTKRVNVKAPIAIRTITPPIYGTCNNIIMTTGDILKCLCKRATVEEILPDGSTIRLSMRNYYTDNGAGLDAKNNVQPVKEEKVPEAVSVTEPVITPTEGEKVAEISVIESIITPVEEEKVPEAPSQEAQVVETTKTEMNDDEVVGIDESTDYEEDSVEEDADTLMDEEKEEETENVTDVVEEVASTIIVNKASNKKKSSSKKKKK